MDPISPRVKIVYSVAVTDLSDPISRSDLPIRSPDLPDLPDPPGSPRIPPDLPGCVVLALFRHLFSPLRERRSIPFPAEPAHRHLSDPENPESWLNVISDLIAGHENVYADISFTAHEPDFFR